MKSAIKQSYLELLNQNVRIVGTNLEIIEDLNKKIKIVGILWLLDILTLYSDDIVLRIYKLFEIGGNKNSIPNIIKNITCTEKRKLFNDKTNKIKKLIDDVGISTIRNDLIAHSDKDKDNAGFWGTRLSEEKIEKIKNISQKLIELTKKINEEFGNNQINLDSYNYLVEQYKAFLEVVKINFDFYNKRKLK